MKTPSHRAIRIVGAKTLSEELGVNRSAVWNWARRGVPPQYARKVSELSGIPTWELCPEFFFNPEEE